MLISEAIALLQNALQEHGDLPLRLYTDHEQLFIEQSFMNMDSGKVSYSPRDDYYLYRVYDTPEECEGYCVDNLPYKFYCLGAY